MHSSQYSVPQQGVLTASRKSLLSMGHTRVESVGVRSRTSAAVNPLGRETCFCHEALKPYILICRFKDGKQRDTYESGWAIT